MKVTLLVTFLLLTLTTGFAAGGNGNLIFSDSFEAPPVQEQGRPLGDTGVTTCGNATHNDLPCNITSFPGQDGDYGRDINANDGNNNGTASFSYTKLDSNGVALPNQAASYLSSPWSCVRDETSGLIWEVKTSSGLHAAQHTYSWYHSDASLGMEENGGHCVDNNNCDTEKYIAAVNAARLCGHSNWRLPSQQELLSIINYGSTQAPLLDSNFFPNTGQTQSYWSSQHLPRFNRSRFVNFATGITGNTDTLATLGVRAVSAGGR